MISTSPWASALCNRNDTGSMSSAVASLSICASWAKQVCTAPKPRMAPHGGLFVRMAKPSIAAMGTRYGPVAKHDALAMTADDDDA